MKKQNHNNDDAHHQSHEPHDTWNIIQAMQTPQNHPQANILAALRTAVAGMPHSNKRGVFPALLSRALSVCLHMLEFPTCGAALVPPLLQLLSMCIHGDQVCGHGRGHECGCFHSAVHVWVELHREPLSFFFYHSSSLAGVCSDTKQSSLHFGQDIATRHALLWRAEEALTQGALCLPL